MRTRVLSATLAAAAFAAPLTWLLAAPIEAVTRRALSQPPPEAKAFAVEIPELRYLRVRGGGSTHRLRLTTRSAADFAKHSQVSLLVATYDTRPSLNRAELAIAGTDCVFRTLPGALFPNNELLTFVRGAACSRIGDTTAGELRLTTEFDQPARVALWADAAADQDLKGEAIVISDRLAPDAPRRPMLRGALVDVDPSKQLSRAALLGYVWQVSASARWIWLAVACCTALVWLAVFTLSGLRDEFTVRRATTQAMTGGFCAAAATTLAYAVLVPPFQSADEPNHFVGFAAFVHRADVEAEAGRWARLGHFERIQFRPEEHFTPADVGLPGIPWNDGTVPDPSLRGAAIQWLWRAVPSFVRQLPVPRLLLALRLVDGLVFSSAVAMVFGLIAAAGERRRPELYAIPIFLVPTLPFFAMTVSNYGLATAAYVLLAAGLVLDWRDERGAEWSGPLIGFGWAIAALTARSALPLAPFIAAWLAGRLVVGARDRQWRAALVYWIGVTAFLVAGLWLADKGYVRTTVGFAEPRVSAAVLNVVSTILAQPWLLFGAGLAAAAVQHAVSLRLGGAAFDRGGAILRRAALAAPILMVASLAGSVLYRYPKVAFVDSAHPPAPAAYVKSVMAAALTTFRVTNLDFLTSWSFWGGFGWLETVPPAAFVSVLASASGLAFAGLVYLLARQGDVRRLIRVGLAVAGAATSMAAYALSVVIATPADLHGRYVIGLYLCALTIAWIAIPLFVSERPRWGGVIRSGCAAAFVAVHVVSLAVILTRYF